MRKRIRLSDVKHALPKEKARVLVDWINRELAREESPVSPKEGQDTCPPASA